MGIVFSGMFGAGLVLYVSIQSEVHLDHILFGDMLGISLTDIMQTTAIALGIALIIGLKWKDLLLHAFDPHQAKASGLNPLTALRHVVHDSPDDCRHAKICRDNFVDFFTDCSRRHRDLNDAKIFSRLVAGGGDVGHYLIYGGVSVIFHRQRTGSHHRRIIFPAVCDYFYLCNPARSAFRESTSGA